MSNTLDLAPTVLRRDKVQARTGLSRSSIYQMMAEGRFPKPIHLGTRAVGWLEHSINQWIEDRVKAAVFPDVSKKKRQKKLETALIESRFKHGSLLDK